MSAGPSVRRGSAAVEGAVMNATKKLKDSERSKLAQEGRRAPYFWSARPAQGPAAAIKANGEFEQRETWQLRGLGR